MTIVTVLRINKEVVTLTDENGRIYQADLSLFPDTPRPRDEYDATVVQGKIVSIS